MIFLMKIKNNNGQSKIGASLAAHPLVVHHIHSLSADMVSANELVLFQLSGLLGCFSDIVGQDHAVHEVEDTPMNPRKAAILIIRRPLLCIYAVIVIFVSGFQGIYGND